MGDIHNLKFEEPINEFCPSTQLNFHKFLEAAGLDSMLIKNGRRISDSEVLAEFSHGFAILPVGEIEERSALQACLQDVESLHELLKSGEYDVNEVSMDGETALTSAVSANAVRADPNLRGKKVEYAALMEAALAGYTDIARLLLQYGASVTQTANNENTALHNAATAGHLDCVKLLLEYGSPLELQNETGHTPLMEATSNGHIEVARCLIENGANINSHSTEFKESALTLASYKGHTEMVQFLLEAGADHEHRTDEMHTALMEAAMEGHIEVARLLLAHGANVNIPQDSFESPLTLAACGGHTELALLLLGYEADIEEVNDEGYTPLMEAAREGHEETVALLLAYGADVNSKTEETQETALTLAACGGFIEVCEMLLNAGADLEVGGMECSTPLMEAAQEGHLDLVHRLLERDADVNAQTATGDTALHYAAENGHYKVCKELLEWGASCSPMAEGGRTPLMKAARAGHLEVVQLLVQWGVVIDQMTIQSDANALSLSCNGGHVAVVEYLLMSGADPHIQLRDGSTMLIEAARSGNPAVLRLILDFPKSLNMSVLDNRVHSQLDVSNRPPISVYESAIASLQQSHNQSTLTLQQQALAVTTSFPSSDFNVAPTSCSPTSTNRLNAALANAFAAGWASGAAALVKNKKPMIRSNVQGVPEPFLLNEIGYSDENTVEEVNDFNDYQNQSSLCDTLNSKNIAATTCISSTTIKTTEKTSTVSNGRPLSAADILGQFTDSNNDISAILNLFGELMPELKGDHVELVKRFSALMDPICAVKAARNTNSVPVGSETPGQINPSTDIDSTGNLAAEIEMAFRQEELNYQVKNDEMDDNNAFKALGSDDKVKTSKLQNNITTDEQSRQKFLNSINSKLSFLKKLKKESNMKNPEDRALLKKYFDSRNQTAKDISVSGVSKPQRNNTQSRPTRSCSSPSIPLVTSGTIAAATTPCCSSAATSLSSTSAASSMCSSGTSSYSSSAQDGLRYSDMSRATSVDRAVKVVKKNNVNQSGKQINVVNCDTSDDNASCAKSSVAYNDVGEIQKCEESMLSVRDENLKSFMEGFEYARQHIALTASNVQAQTPSVSQIKGNTSAGLQAQHLISSNSIPSPPSLLPCPNHGTPSGSVLTFAPNGFIPAHNQQAIQLSENTPNITDNCLPEQSIDVNACIESSMESALTLACNGGFVELVRLLIERGADKEHRDKKTQTPLHTAVFANQRAIVTLLLDYGADIEAQLERTKDTALSIACSHGKLEIVEELLKRGANKEHRNISDYTPLSLAASGGFVEVIQTLLRHGAEINSRTGSKLGISPLMLAAMNGHTAAVKLLLDNGSDINAQIETNRNTALTLACFQGRHEVVSLLLERKANCEQRAKTGLTPLMEAASGDYVEVGKILLSHGAEVNASPVVTSRDTALTIAADKGNLKFVNLLLQKGALVDAKNKKGATPLWLACNGESGR